jgi:hypothetical protein
VFSFFDQLGGKAGQLDRERNQRKEVLSKPALPGV